MVAELSLFPYERLTCNQEKSEEKCIIGKGVISLLSYPQKGNT
jgi:hypothetical protein